MMKLAIYYASFFYFLAAPILLWLMIRHRRIMRVASMMLLGILSCLAYARFVEPQILRTKEHDVALAGCFDESGAVRVALFSDTHNGLFPNALPISQIARRVEAVSADFVLIAGDFTYHLEPEKFEETFAALSTISAPVFAVLGNHDLGIPGPNLSEPLMKILPGLGVRLIDDRALKLSNSKFAIELIGLSDQWARAQKLSLLRPQSELPRLVLTHNSETIRDFRSGMWATLLLGGHTHGGQIQLPFITCWVTGVCGDLGYGLREENETQIFTTSGTGMVGLPMRFRVPPVIDVLNISYKACAAG